MRRINIKKSVLSIVSILACCLFFVACSSSSDYKSETNKSSSYSESSTHEEVRRLLENTLSDSEVMYDSSSDMFVIKIIRDGMADIARVVEDSDWMTVREGLEDMSISAAGFVESYNLDSDIVVCIMNDERPNEMFLAAAYGEIIYDYRED